MSRIDTPPGFAVYPSASPKAANLPAVDQVLAFEQALGGEPPGGGGRPGGGGGRPRGGGRGGGGGPAPGGGGGGPPGREGER
ncbi:hypothetical protein QCC25_17300, partial [Pseudomonas aeruginosa]|nr:hypothetical protein [Pseudomonas aeruginosa]